MKKLISYYDLLKLIQDDEEPELIMLHLNCGSMAYQPIYDDGEFSHYERVENHNSENFKTYLADTLLESQMIEPNIEILDNKKIEKIKIDNYDRIQAPSTGTYCYKLRQIDKIIIKKLNEVIDEVNELKEKE